MSNFIRRVLLLFVVIMFVVNAIAWWVSRPKASSVVERKYKLTAFAKEKENVKKVKQLAEKSKYQVEVKQVKKIGKKPAGLKLVFEYDDKEALQNIAKMLKEKKVATKIKEDEETGRLYLMVDKIYKDKQKAEKVARRMEDITYMKFTVEQNYKKFPYQTNEITVTDIPGKEEAEALKEEIAGMVEEEISIEMMPLEGGESPAGEEQVKTKKKTGETPEKNKDSQSGKKGKQQESEQLKEQPGSGEEKGDT